MKSLNLDTATPEEVPQILRNAAEQFRESQSELQAAWGDPQAGKCWQHIANRLERVADQIERDARCHP